MAAISPWGEGRTEDQPGSEQTPFCPRTTPGSLPYLGVPLEGVKSSGHQDQLGLELRGKGTT